VSLALYFQMTRKRRQGKARVVNGKEIHPVGLEARRGVMRGECRTVAGTCSSSR
jgi:hypothetical protein